MNTNLTLKILVQLGGKFIKKVKTKKTKTKIIYF